MEAVTRPPGPPPRTRIDWTRLVMDFADAWPFDGNHVALNSVCYITSDGVIRDCLRCDDFSLDQAGGDTILGHLTDGRMFVSSRDGITAFEAKQ